MPDKNVQILVRDDDLTFMAMASPTNMNQLLDVPLDIMRALTIESPPDSQENVVDVMIQLDTKSNASCFLDGKEIKVEHLFFTGRPENVSQFASRLKKDCKSLRLSNKANVNLGQEEENLVNYSQSHDSIEVQTGEQDQDENESSDEDEDKSLEVQHTGKPSQDSLAVDRKGAEDLEALEEDDNLNLPPPRVRNALDETLECDPSDDDLAGTESLCQQAADASDQATTDLDDESPSQNRRRKTGQSDASPIAKLVTKQAPRPARHHVVKPIPKFPELTKKSIKPKAKTPIGGIISSQVPIVASQVNSLPKAKLLSEPLKKPFPGIKTGAAAVSKLALKSKPPAKVTKKAQSKPSIKNKVVVLDDDDDDEITSPDINDETPPPKAKYQRSQHELKLVTKEKSSTVESAPTAAPKNPKRFSLHPTKLVESQPVVKGSKPVFDFPSDEEEEAETKRNGAKAKPKAKAKAKSRKSAGEVEGKPAKSNTKKKRQSAPATIQPSIGTRHSQRGAAAQANAKMKAADALSDKAEEAEEDQETQMPRSTALKSTGQTKKASKLATDHVADLPVNDDDAEGKTRLTKVPLKNSKGKKVPVKPVKVPTIDAVGSDDEAENETQLPRPAPSKNAGQRKKVDKAANPQITDAVDSDAETGEDAYPLAAAVSKSGGQSKKIGTSRKAQLDAVDSKVDIEEETVLSMTVSSMKRIQKTVFVEPVKVRAINTSEGDDEDDEDDVVAKASEKTVIFEKSNHEPAVAKLVAKVQNANESEQEEKADFVQHDPPKQILPAKTRTTRPVATKLLQFDDSSEDEETQMPPLPKVSKLADSLDPRLLKKPPAKIFKSEERVQDSDGSENEEQVAEQTVKDVEQVDGPSTIAAKSASTVASASTPRPVSKSKVIAQNNVDPLGGNFEVGSKKRTPDKDYNPTVVSSSTRVLRSKLAENKSTPKKIETRADATPQVERETVDGDMFMQHDYSQLLEDAPLAALEDEDEEVLVAPSCPPLSKPNTGIKKQAFKTYSTSEKPKLDWANSLSQMLEGEPVGESGPKLNSLSSRKRVLKDDQEDNMTLAKDPATESEPAFPSAQQPARILAKIPAIEEDIAVPVSSSVVKKKRKSAEDDQEFSNKRRIIQSEELKSIPKPSPAPMRPEVKKGVAIAVTSEPLVSATTDEDLETQPLSTKPRPAPSGSDDTTKQSKLMTTIRTHTRGSMGPPPLSAIQHRSISGLELVDDYLQRKPHVISFDVDGPRNQGIQSAHNNPAGRVVQLALPEPKVSTTLPSSADLKRKRGMSTFGAEHTMEEPQKKKLSPEVEERVQDDMGVEQQIPSSPPQQYELENAGIDVPRSPPQAASALVPSNVTLAAPPRPIRQSSGSSRVNHNGSPQPSPNVVVVDLMGQLKQRLSQEIHDSMSHSEKSSEDEPVDQRKTMLAPKVRISSLTKAVPSSPSDLGDRRYVAHNEVQDGQYHSLLTQGVIKEQAQMADPFSAEKPSRSNSTFMERLQSRDGERRSKLQYQQNVYVQVPTEPRLSRSAQTLKNLPRGERRDDFDDEDIVVNSMHQGPIPRRGVGFKSADTQSNLIDARTQPKGQNSTAPSARNSHALQAKSRSKVSSIGERTQPILFTRDTRRRVSTDDEDRTLVNASRGRHNPSSPSMSSGSSFNSSNGSRTPREKQPNDNDQWNSAVRPHLRGVSDALHRVADVSYHLIFLQMY